VLPTPQNDRRQRRRFTPDDKTRILREADACKERGELGALLRREGIYNSHLTNWRAQMRREGIAGLSPKRPGPKPSKDEKDHRIEKLEKEKAKLEKELRISRKLIELQIKAHEILGIALPRIEDATEDDSSSSSDSATRRSR
jgi:transposase-like protein